MERRQIQPSAIYRIGVGMQHFYLFAESFIAINRGLSCNGATFLQPLAGFGSAGLVALLRFSQKINREDASFAPSR
jgi:hypothetical protein